MHCDIILAGVGGQGILSIAFCICNAALKRGLGFKQAEVHGMAQRGGTVQSHLRLSDDTIHSDLIPVGHADLLISVEPLESLRYACYLGAKGTLISSNAPYENIPDYPPLDGVIDRIGQFDNHILINASKLAREAGSGRADNMVMLGAAAAGIGFEVHEFDPFVRQLFARKAERVVEMNLQALRLGRLAADLYVQQREAGLAPGEALRTVDAVDLASQTAERGAAGDRISAER
jgi:indolepyruvate ferredoxin oxidoreductase beta subunit